MYRSWMVPVIILFWAVTSGWLVCAKILPTLSVGAAPGYQAFYASGNRLVPVAWTVLWNDQPLGWSTSQARRTPGGGLEVESLLHFDRLPLDEVLPSWSKMLLRQPVAGGESYAFDARGHLAIDAQGELRTFSSVVSLPATPEKLFLHGRIDAGMRAQLRQVVGSVLLRDTEAMVDALEHLQVADSTGDRSALRADLQHMLDTFADSPAGEVPVAEILSGLLTTVRRHRLRLPPDLLLLLATVVECEGVAVQLDPGFVLYPVLARWAAAGLAGT